MSNQTIWKTPLEITDEQILYVPRGSNIIHVGVQSEQLYAWYLCSPDNENVMRRIYIVGTGNPMPVAKTLKSIGTVLIGQFVWHVFDGGDA